MPPPRPRPRFALLSCVGGLAVATAAIAVRPPVAAAEAGARMRPLLRDFVGLNSFAPGHHSPHRGFDPELYRPTARLLREYHRVSRDLGDNASEPAPFPRGKDGTDWPAIYREWKARGWKVHASLQFELVERTAWRDLENDARNYGRAYARAFGPSGELKLVDTAEIGNEPTEWSDADFARMFRAMAQGLREGDPRMKLATSNVTVGPSGRWDKSVELVAPYRELFDVLTLHIYAELAQHPTWERSYPEDPRLLRYLNDVEALCRWRDRHAPEKEVWITEFGYDSSTKTANPDGEYPEWRGVTDEQQAQWLVRSLLVFAAMPVERAYIYFFNDRDVPSLHASAGITRNFEPKPSYHALAQLQRMLGDYRFGRVLRDEPGRVRVHEFVHGEDSRRIVWTVWSPTGRSAVERRTLGAAPGRLVKVERMSAVAGYGQAEATRAGVNVDGTIDVEVTESPLYLVWER